MERSDIDAGQEIFQRAYLSGDGRRLMVLTEAGALLTWRLPARDERGTKLDQAARVSSEKRFTDAALSKDGGLVLAASDDGSALLFDVSSNSPSVTLAEHLGQIRSVSLSMDSRYALVTTGDGAVRIWDIAAHRSPAIQFRSFSPIPLTAQLDPGNRNLITTFKNGIVVKSPMYMDDTGYAAQVEHKFTRCLSQVQRQAFGLLVSEQEPLDSHPISNIVTAPDATGHCPN